MLFDKILCTGGSGRMGYYVVNRIMDKCDLTVLDLKPPPQSRVAYCDTNIMDHEGLKKDFAGHEAVLHLAAIPNPRIAPADVTFKNNVIGTWSVLDAAEEAGVKRVVVASSDAIFGLQYNTANGGPHYLPVDEDYPIHATDFYSLSKECTETICKSYIRRAKMEIVIIRSAFNAFPSLYPELRHRGNDVHNYHLWAYVAPEDVAQAFELCLSRKKCNGKTFIIAAKDGLNVRPTLEMLQERYGRNIKIKNMNYFKTLKTASILNTTKASNELGYDPVVSWQELEQRIP
ncbi:MAG: NAD(P)-dependent oxidoreductase [Desulfatiglandales bacterium]|jgi:nucleoside-diphosphate-sugar epimerase|nr:NAD(P)-dependent oxidoreductase [Desulfatiglandales bacterium]